MTKIRHILFIGFKVVFRIIAAIGLGYALAKSDPIPFIIHMIWNR